jgi:peptidoglycan hydrolase FlgJ
MQAGNDRTATVAINPPSDIVLDVARAADPEKYRMAAERLARLRATPSTETFMLPAAPTQVATPADVANTAATPTRPLDAGASAQSRRRLDPYGQFEAFVLQSFVQSMLPKNATTVFGKGSAGEFWRSMLAEKMGDELARSGQVGIARRLAAGPSHPVQPASVVTASPTAVPPPQASTLIGVQTRESEGVPRVDAVVPSIEPASERS